MSIISCIYWTIRRFIWNLFCWKISDILEKVIWRQYATPKSNNAMALVCLTCGHTSISTLPFNVHQDYHINPVMPLNTLARNCRNFIDNENHIFIVTQINLDSFWWKKISPTFHTKTGKYLDLFSIVCSNKILMCLSCLRQLPRGKFDHFKSEN